MLLTPIVMALLFLWIGDGSRRLDPDWIIPFGLLFGILATLRMWAMGPGFADPRGYLYAAPVDRASHVVVKIASGAVWVIVVCLVFLISLMIVHRFGLDVVAGLKGVPTATFEPEDSVPGWQWMLTVPAGVLGYLFASVPSVASRKPRLWFMVFIGTVMTAFTFGIAGEDAGRSSIRSGFRRRRAHADDGAHPEVPRRRLLRRGAGRTGRTASRSPSLVARL